jgi:WXG100 family type VII secretion target
VPSGELNYPPEVLTMVTDMQKTVAEANQQMQTLGTNVNSLAGSSSSQAVGSFNDVHRQWNQLMQEHNQVLGNVAGKARQGYDDMIAFDRQTASRIQGN